VSILYGTQLDRALDLLTEQIQQIAKEYAQDILSTPEILGVESIKDSKVVLRAKIKTKPGRTVCLGACTEPSCPEEVYRG